MKVKDFIELVNKYNIPVDCDLMSDSGWECDSTDIDGFIYLPKQNKLIGYQHSSETLLKDIKNAFVSRDERHYPWWYNDLPYNLAHDFSKAELDTLSNDDIIVIEY